MAPAKWRDERTDLHKRIRRGEFCSERVRRWRDDLGKIANDVSGLYVHRQVYDAIGGIIAANPRLQRPNLFLSELFEWYVMTNVVLANRDAEVHRYVVSLANVLQEVADHAKEISRRAFRKMHTGTAYIPQRVADEYGDTPEHDDVAFLIEPLYDEYCLPTDRERLHVEPVRADLLELRAAAAKVETFRNEVAGHRAREASITEISVAAIHGYVDALDRLVRKYERLLFGAAPSTLNPVTQVDWTEIFRFAWIPPAERGYAVPYAATVDVALAIVKTLRPDERKKLKDLLSSLDPDEA